MNWAWHQALPSTQKFVLLALADMADDDGVCWPSMSTLAKRCAVSTRTVRRALRDLTKLDFLQCELRHRGDGSTTSNRYVLNLGGDDTVSGAPDTHAPREGRPCQRAPRVDVTPRTTTRTVIDPSPPPGAGHTDSGTGNSGGELRKLSFPSELTEAECAASTRRLEEFPTTLAQQLLDELNGRMQRGEIKTTPLAYLGGMTNCARAGTFVPEIGRPTQQHASRVPQTHAERPARPAENSRKAAPVYPDITNNPLCQRVAAIQNRATIRDAARTTPITTAASAREQDASDEFKTTRIDVESTPVRVKFPELARVIGG